LFLICGSHSREQTLYWNINDYWWCTFNFCDIVAYYCKINFIYWVRYLSAMFYFGPLFSSVSGLNMLCIWCPWRQRFGPGSHYSGRTVEISPPKIPCPYYSMRNAMWVRKFTLTITDYLYKWQLLMRNLKALKLSLFKSCLPCHPMAF
jgi:hypothetical protein